MLKNIIRVKTAKEMLDNVTQQLPTDILICSAAVADWKLIPKTSSNNKIDTNNKIKKTNKKLFFQTEKNPDILEYLRGKSGITFGNLFSMFTILKGLPLSYFKDLQDDKEIVFKSNETLNNCILIFAGLTT